MKAIGSVRNLTRGSIVAKECFYAETALQRIRGLMFSPKRCLLFKCNGFLPVHSLFVFFPITLLYIRKGRVVERHFLKPFTLHYKNKQPAEYLLEVPGECAVKRGERIAWVGGS